MIFLGFVDSWAAVASGGLSLSENYLYTTEAFRAYYDHLTPDGVLSDHALARRHPAAGRRTRSRCSGAEEAVEARGGADGEAGSHGRPRRR